MRTRFTSWAGPVAVLAAASAVVAVRGQDAPPPPRFFQDITRPDAGSALPPASRPVQYGVGLGGNRNPPDAAPRPQPPRPKISSPVIAGPDGVRQVGAAEPGFPSAPGRAAFPVTPPGPGLPPPSISVEAPAAPPELPPAVRDRPAADSPPGFAVPPAPAAIDPPTPRVSASGFAPLPPAGPSEPPAAVGQPLPARQAPNLVVEVLAPEASGVGMPLTYELLVRNVGSSAVSGVRVEEEVPARAVLVATDPPAENAGDRLAWPVGVLDAGAEKRFKVTVRPGEEGEIRSRATVSVVSAVDARVRITRPRVGVAVVGAETARVGERVPLQIRLTNTGSGPATRVVLQAKFTEGLVHGHGPVIEAEVKDLPAGQTKTLTLDVGAAKAGPQACVVTAAADGNPPETARVAVNLVEPLLVLKQTGPERCLVRSEPTFTIDLSNPGTAATDPVTVWASLPDGFEFLNASDGGMVAAARTVAWRLPGLPAGSAKAVTLKVRAVAPANGVIRTAARASAATEMGTGVVAASHQTGGAAAGGKPLEARAESAVKAEGVPALRFEVADLEDPVPVGRDAVYEIKVQNTGTGPCTGVQLVCEVSDGGVASGATGPTQGRASGGQVIFDPIPEFGVKAEAVYRVRVRAAQPGDARVRVRLTCNEVRNPVAKEENTRFFKE